MRVQWDAGLRCLSCKHKQFTGLYYSNLHALHRSLPSLNDQLCPSEARDQEMQSRSAIMDALPLQSVQQARQALMSQITVPQKATQMHRRQKQSIAMTVRPGIKQ